ncbi:hypothetical protein CVT26_015995 [Gymnopilus dilepis]|uniref:Phosducin domain-containing protein n=1 Tax=Gymnopilus dilepis TaxID=231916 RepID=A0A409YDJ3_9AGAR|nr:hypothetical protein CVT26_015995 [Gymnopilus dilepis]
MYADIEALVLSGDLFNGRSGTSSPERSESPDKGWHDEELQAAAEKLEEKGLDYDSDTVRREAAKQKEKEIAQSPESIGMGPGRTGVKGVIRDRDEAAEIQREQRAREAEEMRRKFEAANLGGKTFLEEEREKAMRGEKADALVFKDALKAHERRDVWGQKREGKFGHLREVGLKGYLSAVEKEQTGTWVVVHLYDPSLDRCYAIDETLARLARLYPDTKFLRAKASSLGFASLNNSSKPAPIASRLRSVREDDDEDDPYGYDEKDDYEDDEDDDEDGFRDQNVDLDMLPTILVYRNGQLVHNWVRVDWEAGPAGLEELLDKHNILPRSSTTDNLGLPSDDEDFDLMWSDEDEKP